MPKKRLRLLCYDETWQPGQSTTLCAT